MISDFIVRTANAKMAKQILTILKSHSSHILWILVKLNEIEMYCIRMHQDLSKCFNVFHIRRSLARMLQICQRHHASSWLIQEPIPQGSFEQSQLESSQEKAISIELRVMTSKIIEIILYRIGMPQSSKIPSLYLQASIESNLQFSIKSRLLKDRTLQAPYEPRKPGLKNSLFGDPTPAIL